jgi:hypothetical protein
MEHKDCKYWQFYYEEELSDPEILDIVWEQWNAGSGNESEEFLKRNVRSMMVGDYIHILGPDGGVWHECLPFGWRIDVPWEEVMGKIDRDKKAANLSKDEISKLLVEQLELDRWRENNSDKEISFSE